MGYIAMTAFALNIVVAVVLSAVLRTTKFSNGVDETAPSDYFADAGDPRVEKDKAARMVDEADPTSA
jgi:SSS family solute:Na+ symporter